ncbi:DUF4292 domain-containing protein [uncultured Eudoraea sp.]|uniref:DUF4292 domain-containing protein n=1 Tax=uncultured Eudoraea sp. TaxID=1035614 RepID=UPI0026053823|nr:DUF4292 domain-containing protein [uncultured Eudoraea sp.]
MKYKTYSWKNWIVTAILAILSFSCKSSKVVLEGKVDEKLTTKAIIKNHYKNQLEFKTISGKLKIEYNDGSSVQTVSVSLRLEKDNAIWISAPLGVVKALVTPKRVTFYNKLQNEYFDGDFNYFSELLGTDLDFDKLQNLLLGQALFDLRTEKYVSIPLQEYYELKPKIMGSLFKTLFLIEPKNFKIATQQLSQPWNKRLLEIYYKSYQKKDKMVFPEVIQITAIDIDQTTNIAIQFRSIELNRALNFPYKIPKGYEEIVLK